MKNKIKNKSTVCYSKLMAKLHDKKGLSDFVVAAILIIIVLVIAVAIFFPQISSWFEDVFMKGVIEKTNELFNFTP